MNYSESELCADDEALIERALPLLPEIGKLLYASISRYQAACGLTLGPLKAMWQLYSHGRRTVGEVATGMGVSMPTASELVDRLVEAGLAERGVNPADRRQVLVWLTPEAERMASEMRAMRRSQLQAALDRLAPEERPIFVRSLEALIEGLRQGSDKLPVETPDGQRATASQRSALADEHGRPADQGEWSERISRKPVAGE